MRLLLFSFLSCCGWRLSLEDHKWKHMLPAFDSQILQSSKMPFLLLKRHSEIDGYPRTN